MKGILITIAILITFILGAILWLWFGSDSNPEDFTNLPVDNKVFISIGNNDEHKLVIATEEGAVEINDVRTLSITDQRDEDIYEVGGFSPDNLSPEFNIIFSESQGSFAISINKIPLAQNRLLAEQHLQSILGISNTQMCQLNVFVGVPYKVDPTVSGKNLGFSFCPDSVSLE